MKKIIKLFLVILVLFFIFYSLSIFLIKTFLNEEKIKNLIHNNLAKAGYEFETKKIYFSFYLFDTSALLEDVHLENEVFNMYGKLVKISFNPINIIFKKRIDLKNINLVDFELVLKNKKTDEMIEKDTVKGKILEIFTDIYLKKGKIVYDKFFLTDLSGHLKVQYDSSLSFETNLLFDFNYEKYSFNSNRLTLKGSFDSSLYLEKVNLKNSLFEIYGNLKKNDNNLNYNLSYTILKSDSLTELIKIKNLSSSGILNGTFSGLYILGKPFKEQTDSIIKNLELQFSNFNLSYDKYKIKISDDCILNKQNENIVLWGDLCFNDDTLQLNFILNFQKIFQDTLNFIVNLDAFNLKNLQNFISDKKLCLNGESKVKIISKIERNLLKNLDSLINYSNILFSSPSIKLLYDTVNLDMSNIDIKMKKGILKGLFKFENEYLKGLVNISGDLLKSMVSLSTLSKFKLGEFVKNYSADGEIEGKIDFNIKDKSNYGNLNLKLVNLTGEGFNDSLRMVINGLTFKNLSLEVKIKTLFFDGRYISGNSKDLSFNRFKDKIILSGNLNLDFVNYDSLFFKKNIGNEKKESKPPVIDKKYKGTFKITASKFLFKDELLENVRLDIILDTGLLMVKNVNSNFLKGNIGGNFSYFSYRDGYVESYFEAKDIVIDDFMERKEYLPFDIGSKIFTKTQLNFYHNKVKKSLKGKIDVESKEGWIHFTGLMEKISSTLNLPIPDTFFFDDMYGEFEIDSQRVKFEDFEMRKNGHHLVYGGKVDFNKVMDIEGIYLIDMRIADTGLLEKILRMSSYPSDSIVVKFRLKGDYKKPNIIITYNSIGSYLKEKTDENINRMLNDLKTIFKR